MIFSPKIGLHENVMVLDYENEYANLILKNNLSYETIVSKTDGRIIRQEGRTGPASDGHWKVFSRDEYFSKIYRKRLHINTDEWLCCEQRIVALKDILVSLTDNWFILE